MTQHALATRRLARASRGSAFTRFLRNRRALLVGTFLAIATLVVFVVAWSQVSDTTATFTSRPADVFRALSDWFTNGVYLGNIVTTLSEAGAGFAIAVIAATVAAVLISSSRFVADVFAPVVSIINITPRVALAPVFLLIFGIAYASKVYFVAAVVGVIPFYALLRALTTIDPVIRDNTKMLGASRLEAVRDVYVPAVLGAMIASLRVSVSFALLSSVFIEIIASNAGIGYAISQAQISFRPDQEIAAIIVVALIGFIFDRLLLLLERRFSSWRVAS